MDSEVFRYAESKYVNHIFSSRPVFTEKNIRVSLHNFSIITKNFSRQGNPVHVTVLNICIA